MKFKAENFEATATNVNGGDWVVEASGNTAHSLRLERGDDDITTVSVFALHGWTHLTKGLKPRPLEKTLATAIAVLYSVPGVVCVEAQDARQAPCVWCAEPMVAIEDGNWLCPKCWRTAGSSGEPSK